MPRKFRLKSRWSEFTVFSYMQKNADEDKIFTQTRDEIAINCSMVPRTVSRAWRALEKEGFVLRLNKAPPKMGESHIFKIVKKKEDF